jgi:dihydroceramidase
MPGHCFCEHVAPGLVRQPANALSSLAFVVVAGWVFWRAARDRGTVPRSRILSHQPVYSSLFGAACVLIGVGSAFFHASLTFAGQFVDVFGMYLIATFVLLYGLGRGRGISAGQAALAYAALNVVLALCLYFVPGMRRYLFALLIVTAIGFEVVARRRSDSVIEVRYFRWAAGALGIGFVIWTLDITRVFCRPQSVLQGHAAWHLLGAASAACIYLYYRSEVGGPVDGGRHACTRCSSAYK